jgi:phosphonate transport system ATP-binding protein
MITQKHDLVEALRVDKNVLAGALGRLSSWSALRLLFWTRVDELAEAEAALSAVGLAGMARRRTAELSGGEQQRVAIARALIQAPALLLADEPVASLDPTTAHDVLGLLTRLARETGTALLCSLHQPELAERFCDRVVELRDGTLAPLPFRGGAGGGGCRVKPQAPEADMPHPNPSPEGEGLVLRELPR